MEAKELTKGLENVLTGLREDPRAAELAQLLRTACHDMNNALGTLSLEFFSVNAIVDDVSAALPPSELAELKAALLNAEGARDACEELVGVLHASARALDRTN